MAPARISSARWHATVRPASTARSSGTSVRERYQFKPGDKIRLKPDPRLVHLFDEPTGKRLDG